MDFKAIAEVEQIVRTEFGDPDVGGAATCRPFATTLKIEERILFCRCSAMPNVGETGPVDAS
jgi:hypothetical protein